MVSIYVYNSFCSRSSPVAAEPPSYAKPRSRRATGPRTQKTVVRDILNRVEDRLTKEDVKATLGDYIRLVQLEKELEEDEPREIKVTWIEPAKTESENEE